MIIEFHMLKSFPPTNLNRDDTGAPKSCVFGGVQRGRISSQCLKRSWRTSGLFENEAIGALGTRTRKLPTLVAAQLAAQGVTEDLQAAVCKLLSGFANKDSKQNDKGITAQIVFYSQEDIQAVTAYFADLIAQGKTAKEIAKLKAEDVQKQLGKRHRPVSLDIALFGRMVTSDAFANVEAAMQVAHAISTHRIARESDYFTAVDDLISGDALDELGAGMLGDVEYNASCYYLYACLDVEQLRANLQYADDPDAVVRAALPALLESMAYTNPSGKQNTFAGHVLPEAMLVEYKNRRIPVSYVNAFVEPARTSDNTGVLEDSIRKLAKEADDVDRRFGIPVAHRLWFKTRYADVAPHACETFDRLGDLVERATLLMEER